MIIVLNLDSLTGWALEHCIIKCSNFTVVLSYKYGILKTVEWLNLKGAEKFIHNKAAENLSMSFYGYNFKVLYQRKIMQVNSPLILFCFIWFVYQLTLTCLVTIALVKGLDILGSK